MHRKIFEDNYIVCLDNLLLIWYHGENNEEKLLSMGEKSMVSDDSRVSVRNLLIKKTVLKKTDYLFDRHFST